MRFSSLPNIAQDPRCYYEILLQALRFAITKMASEFYLLATIAMAWMIVYPLYLAVTRLYFSPISHIPGPKLSAISGWPEFYYDFFKGGKYIFEIKKMHEKYGKPFISLTCVSAQVTCEQVQSSV
jgi:hypothetical protein